MLGEVAILLAWVPLLTRGRLLHCPLPVSVQPSGTPLEHVPITGDPEISCVGILNLHHPGDLCMTRLLCCLNEQSPRSPETEEENGSRPEILPPRPRGLCVLLSTRPLIFLVLDCLSRQHPSLPVRHLLLWSPLNITVPA